MEFKGLRDLYSLLFTKRVLNSLWDESESGYGAITGFSPADVLRVLFSNEIFVKFNDINFTGVFEVKPTRWKAKSEKVKVCNCKYVTMYIWVERLKKVNLSFVNGKLDGEITFVTHSNILNF